MDSLNGRWTRCGRNRDVGGALTPQGRIYLRSRTAEHRARRRASRATQRKTENCNTTAGQASARRAMTKGELPRDAVARPGRSPSRRLGAPPPSRAAVFCGVCDGRVSGPARSAFRSSSRTRGYLPRPDASYGFLTEDPSLALGMMTGTGARDDKSGARDERGLGLGMT